MKPTFENTVNILVKAYLNDTLVHNNCYACAVGNLVAHGMGYSFVPCIDRPQYKKIVWDVVGGVYVNEEGEHAGWYETLGLDWLSDGRRTTQGMKEIESTGYEPEQLVRIENAFENAGKGKNDDEWMFNGLMSVVEVLADIHGVDLTTKESAKALFVKTPAL